MTQTLDPQTPRADGFFDLDEQSVILDVVFHRPGTSRRGDINLMETDADRESLRLTKDAVKSQTYRDLCRVSTAFRHFAEARALPCMLKRGTCRIPVALLPEVYAELMTAKSRYMELADQFVREWPDLVEEAKLRLKSQFNEKDYPPIELLRTAFWVEKRVFEIRRPSADKIGQRIATEEEVAAMADLKKEAEEMKLALRQAAKDILTKLANGLGEKSDGTKGIVREETYQRYMEFIEFFDSRNRLAADHELAAVIVKAKQLLEGRSRDALQYNEALRFDLQPQVEMIARLTEGLVTQSAARMITFDE